MAKKALALLFVIVATGKLSINENSPSCPS